MAINKPRVLFYSSVPDVNIGQVFMVSHAIEALEENGWITGVIRANEGTTLCLPSDTRLLVIFRSGWSSELEQLVEICRARSIVVVFSIDDLIFDPELVESGNLTFFNHLSEYEKNNWRGKAVSFNRTLIQSDAAVLTTRPLAIAAARYCRNTSVLPNMFNRAMVTLAEQAGSMPKPSQFDSRIRIGFAAGTPTHHRNFEIIVPALCEILSLYPETMLTIVGPLDIQKFENLLPFIPRIEQRPRVSLSELFGEYNCFDINLAPLLVGNQFDESKSELRYGIASLVSVPTVASPAIPMQETILDGDNGLLCDDIESWVSNLKLLVENPELRLKLGKSARRNVISGFGPGALKEKCHEIYSTIIEKGKVAG